MLVHLAPAKLEARIRRSGIRPGEGLFGGYKSDVVYAFPVLPSYTTTHQWTREIMKWRRQPLVGVYFRVPDSEIIEFGHFNDGQELLKVQASVAAGAVRRAADARGFEIILRRPIERKEITRIAPVRGVVGWRHMPDAHLRKPCGCPACVARGEPGGRKLRKRYERGEL
ncbi:MAG: hypothetical protein R3C30_17470 [Hyphomonadaceae bacterium]